MAWRTYINMKNLLFGIMSLFLLIPAVFAEEDVDLDDNVEITENSVSRACEVDNFTEEELAIFDGFKDLELLVRYIEYKEPLKILTGIYKYYALSGDPNLVVINAGIIELEERQCLLILEMVDRGIEFPSGFNIDGYDINDENFNEKLAQDLNGSYYWRDVSTEDIESARSPEDLSKDGFEFGYTEEDASGDSDSSCTGGTCSDENGGGDDDGEFGGGDGANVSLTFTTTGASAGNNSPSDDSGEELLKAAGLGVAAAAVKAMLGGAGTDPKFDLFGVFQKDGLLGDGGKVDTMLESIGINTDAVFQDRSTAAVVGRAVSESQSNVGRLSGEAAKLYGPGVTGGSAVTGDILGEGNMFTGDIKNTFLGWVRMLTSIAAILAVVAVIWGGVLMISSVGDEGRKDLGKKVIIYAIVGLFLMAGAYAIVNLFVEGSFAN